MSIRFTEGQRPTIEEYLDQAAGVCLEFPEGSQEEFHFLMFCEEIYSHGFKTGMGKADEVFRETMKETFKKHMPKLIKESRIDA